MFGDYSQDLLRKGIIEFKAGNREPARRYLDRAVYMSSDHEVIAEAWFWLSKTVDGEDGEREALENCLANNLHHARGRRALAVLDGRLDPQQIIDPNSVPAPTGPDGGEARRFVCPKCGGRMTYTPDGRALVCEYCRRHEGMEPVPRSGPENDFIIAMATRRGHARPLREHVLRCQGCGAEFILPPGRLSFTCAYCNSPHVLSATGSRDLIEPDAIIPHAFDQKRAATILQEWIEQARVPVKQGDREPRGLYVPIWVFEMGGFIEYTAEIPEGHPAAGTGGTGPARVTDRYPVMVTVPIAASERPSAPLVRLIANFELGAAVPYDPRYLADWPAELYDVSMADASLDARSQAYGAMQRQLRDALLPLRVLHSSSANLAVEAYRLILAPAWTLEVFVEGSGGLVLIDGQDGNVSGGALLAAREPKPGIAPWLRELIDDRGL